VYFNDPCGRVTLLPAGQVVPPGLLVKLKGLFYNDTDAPGAGEGVAGCPGMLRPVPGHPDVRFFYGYNSAGHKLSMGAVWQDAGGAWHGSLVLAPAIRCFRSLTFRWGRVRASVGGPGRPLDHVGAGNVIVLWAQN